MSLAHDTAARAAPQSGTSATAVDFPKVYAVIPRGDCMEPLYVDGKPLVVSSRATCEPGDTVVVHFRPECVPQQGFEAIVKRLKWRLLDWQFPWDANGSDLIPMLTLETLNPPRTLMVAYDQILAVHKVLGQVEHGEDGHAAVPVGMLEGHDETD